MSHWQQVAAARTVLDRETGTIRKDPGGKLTVALAYPNSYYVGMSSLALQILYRAFNQHPDVACERIFWDTAAARDDRPLLSLESQIDAAAFNVWAFTVSFEMDYFHIAAMLAQAGVPLLAEERSGRKGASAVSHTAARGRLSEERWPLLVAGGPAVTMNPEPLAPFFDAMVVGEAEEVIDPLLAILRDTDNGADREATLAALARLPGVYVPDRARPGEQPIRRLSVGTPGALEPVSSLYTADTEFAGMHLIEIARGCGRGCRYCLAGYVYRPPREQPADRILAWARAGMARSGGKVGLVSAAVSDHSQIDLLATALQAMGARISVSSMRTDPLSEPLVRALAASGTQTLTIAPEAGSERLRRAINKPQSEAGLLAAVELAQALNFPQLKMYYMIGHPGEDEADIEGIVDLTLKARGIFKRMITINATPFVPKAHTPFQWVAMAPVRTLQARQNALKRALVRHRVEVKADSPQWAEVQAVLARGDRRLAPVLADMAGPVAQGRLTAAAFHQALAAHDLTAAEFTGARALDACLPWRIVESGVSTSYLAHEHRLFEQDRPGHSCLPTTSNCLACGACREVAEPIAQPV